MIILQLALYCVLFTLMVKIAVGNKALNGLCFYPKPVPEKVYELGLTHPIRTNLGSGPEETLDPDTDLDRRGGHCCGNHRIAFLGGIRYGTKRFGTSKEIYEYAVPRKGDLQTAEHGQDR